MNTSLRPTAISNSTVINYLRNLFSFKKTNIVDGIPALLKHKSLVTIAGCFIFIFGLLPEKSFAASWSVSGLTVSSTQTGTLTYGTSGNATYTLTLTESGNGNPSPGTTVFTLNWVTPPSGVTFSPNTAVTLTGSGQVVTLTVSTSSTTPAGNYSFTVSTNGQTYTKGNIIVAPKVLTITGNNKVYDGTTSATTSALSGTVNGDIIGLSGSPVFATKHVGTGKTITGLTLTGAAAGNYRLPTISANITAMGVTVTAQPATKNYDGTTSSGVAPAVGSLFSGDVVGTPPVQTYDTKNVGISKVLTPSGLVVNDGNGGLNYTVSYVSNSFGAVTAANLVITASDRSKTYGSTLALGTAAFVPAGLQNGETIGAVTLNSTGAVNTAGVGAYSVIASGASGGSFNPANYNISYNDGSLTVDPANLTITATPQSKIYGNSFSFTGTEFTPAGLMNGETVGTVTLTSTGVPAPSLAGTYPILPSAATGGTFNTGNYNITYTSGILTVTKAATTTGVVADQSAICIGTNVTFTATVSGSPAGLTGNVQFYDGATLIGTSAVSGGTATFNTNSLSAGSRVIKATYVGDANYSGSTSTTITVDVNASSVGGTTSGTQTICNGAQPTSDLTLAGNVGAVLNWQKSTDAGFGSFTTIANASATLTPATIGALTATTYFRAVVQNGLCTSAISSAVTITVNPIPTISPLANLLSCPSSTVSIAGFTGTATSFTWTNSNTAIGLAASGTGNIATFTAKNTTTSPIIATIEVTPFYGTCPGTPTSFTITVDALNTGNTLSAATSTTICSGTAGPFINGSTPTGGNGTTYAYSWESSTTSASSGFAPAAGVNNGQSYTPGILTQNTWYRRIVSSGTCGSSTSPAIAITIDPVSVGGSITPATTTVCAGVNNTVLSLSGKTGTVVRWEYSLDNFATSGITISNITTSYTASNLTQTTSYRAVVQSGVCNIAYSAIATITVDPAPVGGTVNSGATVCSGVNGATLNLTGYAGTISKWQYSTNAGVSWTDISNLTDNYTYSNLTTTTWFRAAIASGVCSVAFSNPAIITVDPVTVAGSISPSSAAACFSGNSTLLTLSGHTGSVVRWESSTNSFLTINSIANTTAALTVTNITQTTQYRAVVKSGTCNEVATSAVTITVNPVITANTITSSAETVCYNTPASVITAGVPAGGSGTFTYLWQSSTTGSAGVYSAAAGTNNGQNYTSANLTQTTWFRRVVISGGCTDNSVPVQITVTIISNNSASGSAAVCPNTSVGQFTGSTPTGGNGPFTYLWQISTTNSTSDFSPAGGINTGINYTPGVIPEPTWFRRLVMSGGCTDSSALVTINILTTPEGVISPANPTICAGDIQRLDAFGSKTFGSGYFNSNADWEQNLNGGAYNGFNNGSPNAIRWVRNSSGVVYYGNTYRSNDNSDFALTMNKDSGTTITTIFRTESSFSTVGQPNCMIQFYHNFHPRSASDKGTVELSDDNGATWQIVKTYTTDAGNSNPLAFDQIAINQFAGKAQVRVRFVFVGSSASWWALDNVAVTGLASTSGAYVWAPSASLYSDAAATSLISATSVYNTVYAKPSVTTTYSIAASSGTCFTGLTATVNVNPIPKLTAVAAPAVCSGANVVANLTGLLATAVQNVTYTVNNGTPQVVSVSSDATGAGSFTITGLTSANDGQLLKITSITRTDLATQCSTTFTTISTTLVINAIPTISGATLAAPVCAGSTGIINLTGLLANSTSTISYSINGTAQTPVAGVVANASGAASFTTVALVAGNNGQTLAITGISRTDKTPVCPAVVLVNVTLNVNAGPSITSNPASASLCSGSNTTFSVTATAGFSSAITYQWKKAGVDIVGATASTYGLTNITAADAATYTVVVTSCGISVTSAGAVLTVTGAINITAQPVASIFCNGAASTSFSVAATGALSYQWWVSSDGGVVFSKASNGALYSGATTTTLTIANPTISMNGYLYRVVITPISPCTLSVTSQAAKLAQSQTWTGTTSSDWNTPSNWSDGVVPSLSCNDVIIPGGVANNPILGSGISTIKNISILSGGDLILNGTGGLKISGTISNAGVLDVSAGSLEFNGSSAQAITGKIFVGNALKNLRISNPAGISISGAAGDSLRIMDSLSFGISNATLTTNDNLVLASTASGTARVADITNNGNTPGNKFVGKVTVERYYPQSRSWRLVTSPLSGAGSIFDNWQDGAPSTYVPGKGMFVTGPNPSASNGLDDSFYDNYSMKGWNASSSTYNNVGNTKSFMLSNTGTPGIAANIGYYAFVRGDRRRSPDNTIFGNMNNTVLSSKGTLQTGAQTFNFSETGITGLTPKFELIGNPYASSVDFRKLTFSNVVPFRFYVYDPSIGSVGAYVTMEDITNSGNFIASNIGSPQSSQSNFIQSSQAFFVQLIADGPASVTFNETNKTNDYNPLLFRPVRPLADIKSLRITLLQANTDNSTLVVDGAVAQFDEQYSDKVDLEDALKFSNITENLSIKRYNQLLTVERRPLLRDNDTIFLQLSKTTQRNYRFTIEAANLDPAITAYLEDSYTNISKPVNLAAGSAYDFAITADAKSAAVNRFRIVFKQVASGPLPVTFKTVKAAGQGDKIAVDWTVENELNIKQYEVEKSADGQRFVKLNTTAATNINLISKLYNYIDVNPFTGNNFYRIKSIDADGKFGYSNTVQVKMGKQLSGIRIYPNPVTDVIGAEFKNMAAGIYSVRLLNAQGQTVLSKTVIHAPGTSMETIQPDYKLISGIYQLEVTSPEKEITMVKVIVK